ncbi:MAG TPA: hypothetical protein VF074_17285 [Pyrinomonadaceae bacterium]
MIADLSIAAGGIPLEIVKTIVAEAHHHHKLVLSIPLTVITFRQEANLLGMIWGTSQIASKPYKLLRF